MHDVLNLEGNRSLAYAEYGDPHGRPLFFFHGTPGSRIFRPPDGITGKAGVRIITIDRPGYGRSSYQANRRMLDLPGDITRLAQKLGLGKFAVAGHSGGGPYAAACAHALPDRVTRAAILSGAGPAESPGAIEGMSAVNKLGFRYGRYIPWTAWQVILWIIFHRRCSDPAADLDRGRGIRPPADERILQMPGVRETCIRSEIEAFRSGLCGFAYDASLLIRPWGFCLEDIQVPVHLWHGTADDLVPIAMARDVAGRIPRGQLTVLEGEAHLLLFPYWGEILSDLILE